MMALAFLLAAAAWADDRPAISEGTPAILASLDTGNIVILDDQASLAIRGQAYQYVLVRTVLNLFDFGPGLNWTLNPFGYRYGAWGGPGWTGDNFEIFADAMDAHFRDHDLGNLSDQELINALKILPNEYWRFWGPVYIPEEILDPGLPINKKVWVSSLSILGGRFFFGWRPMPFTEYSRRQALAGMQLWGLLP
jgi:hypothetical protein